MKRKHLILLLVCTAILAGCAAVQQQRAVVNDRVISNSSLGLFGFSFAIPEGFDLYNPATGASEQYGEIQQLAIRVYNLNRDYHPRGSETFYDSFLMHSEGTAVLLMTFKVDDLSPSGAGFSFDGDVLQGDQVPLYNISGQKIVQLGENLTDAICTRGHAYEHKGWYYSQEKRKRNFFLYESCKVFGGNRDRYVLMGFCLPGDEEVLAVQMQEMMKALQF